MLDEYTRVLEAVAELGDEKQAEAAVSKLIQHLASSGRVKMLPQIARELKKVLARRKSLAPVVEVAHEKESRAALKAAKEAGIDAKKAEVNHALIEGWRARGSGMLVDRSAKAALVHIYQKVTS